MTADPNATKSWDKSFSQAIFFGCGFGDVIFWSLQAQLYLHFGECYALSGSSETLFPFPFLLKMSSFSWFGKAGN